jgi:hypothetical protein
MAFATLKKSCIDIHTDAIAYRFPTLICRPHVQKTTLKLFFCWSATWKNGWSDQYSHSPCRTFPWPVGFLLASLFARIIGMTLPGYICSHQGRKIISSKAYSQCLRLRNAQLRKEFILHLHFVGNNREQPCTKSNKDC